MKKKLECEQTVVNLIFTKHYHAALHRTARVKFALLVFFISPFNSKDGTNNETYCLRPCLDAKSFGILTL
jgi:hypothetical protein